MITDNTPIERHVCGALPVLVKREDLCCPFPGPGFSKIRGVVAHIRNRPEDTIGVLDTFHSKAGWAVSYVCQALGKRAVNFWPVYKADGEVHPDEPPRPQQRHALALGANLVALPAGRSAVLYHGARKALAREFPGAYLMPNALKLPESVTENAAEAFRACRARTVPDSGVLIVSVSSGTVAAGVLLGFKDAGFLSRYHVVLHMGYSRSIPTMRQYVSERAEQDLTSSRFEFVDEGYGYADASRAAVPFPCNPHYDAKAWAWLAKPEQQERFRGRDIVFWNIGE